MKKAAVVLILIIWTIFIFDVSAPAHAQSIDSQCNAFNGLGTSTIQCTLPTVTSGDVLVAFVEGEHSPNTCGTLSLYTASDIDSLNHHLASWLQYQIVCGGTFSDFAVLNAGLATQSGVNDLITVTVNGGGGIAIIVDIQAYAISNVDFTTLTSSQDQGGNSGTTCSSCTSLTDKVASFIQGNGVTLAGYFARSSVSMSSIGQFSGSSQYGCDTSNTRVRFCSANLLDPTSGTTTLDTTSTASSSNMIGMMVAISFTNLLPIVIPCTWLQMQCWWYPILFYGLYLGMFAMVATKGGAEGRGRTYLMLAALNMASAAQTAMGLLTPVVPLLLITLTVVYVVRFRNR